MQDVVCRPRSRSEQIVESKVNMQDKIRATFLPFARMNVILQRAAALAQSKSTYAIMMHLERSIMQLASIEQYLQLRVQWNPEQVQRQQKRLARQQARLQWQQAMLEQLWDE
jgi:hypothetical protein